jgi:hypothetical protein
VEAERVRASEQAGQPADSRVFQDIDINKNRKDIGLDPGSIEALEGSSSPARSFLYVIK